MANWFKLTRVICLGIALVGFAKAASAAIVVNDDFETGTHPTGVRSVSAGLGIPFWVAKLGTATIATESGNKVLSVTGVGGESSPVVGLIPGTALLTNVGDTINLTFRVRFQNTTAASLSNFRVGLHSSLGTSITADGQTSTSDDDIGYYVQLGNGTQTANNNSFFSEFGGQSTIMSNNDRVAITASGLMGGITSTTFVPASLTLTRTSATNIGISFSLDGAAAITGTTTTLYTSFNEISFSNGFTATTNQNYSIDDVVLNASNFAAIPEPSVVALGVAGLFGALAIRRRK